MGKTKEPLKGIRFKKVDLHKVEISSRPICKKPEKVTSANKTDAIN